MVRMLARSLLVAGALGFSALVPVGTAGAGTACTVPANDLDNNLNDNVEGALGCELGTDNNDQPGPTQVNADAMHGFTDWVDIGNELGAPGSDGGLTITGSVIAGTYSISNAIWSMYDHFMLVFKDGKGDPPFYVGYLLGLQDGDFLTPFLNIKVCDNNQTGPCTERKGISHWQLYAGGDPIIDPDPIPLPGAVWFLLSGLAGLAAIGRARAKA